ncbi:MAG: R3H domain-containing nucleic acid-binding protein [bacterium]|nr:R3H domain-containing nucleic acid-binding protein [bacterium]
MDIDKAKDLLQNLIQTAGLKVDSIDVEDRGEGEFSFNLRMKEDAPVLIGRRGDCLASFQHLVKGIFRLQGICAEGENVRLDVDSYRSQQEQNVLALADKRSQFVVETGKHSVLPPMSPFFRRLVHLHVSQKYPELVTESLGVGTDRAVKIMPAGGSAVAASSDMPDELYHELEI